MIFGQTTRRLGILDARWPARIIMGGQPDGVVVSGRSTDRHKARIQRQQTHQNYARHTLLPAGNLVFFCSIVPTPRCKTCRNLGLAHEQAGLIA